ncbi:helix-turn-helix domain-containing protein [Clostridium thermosuccinogenes]|jgi:AraC-like DNA-binding protein|uniref:helix-turn-helix domain-containing protein n=1 Tax=Clostridium thermosuccinogenes TaxID=84032 RepID=UPI000CCBF7EE|nr:AraC family transcriptional regulator [Pseudoclostridium thermosuccinogenes]PNT94245.1 hypothetical protein CDQ83_12435 [Pseudoclostridium thermosuccinogenes]
MNFTGLNTVEPCLISVANVNELNCPPPGASMGKRTVMNYELDYITWGEGYIVTDGQKIPAKKGSLFFRKPGMVVEGISPYHCYYVVFKMHRDDAGMKNGQRIEFPAIMNIDSHSYIEDLFFQLYNEYICQRDIGEFIIRTYLMQILLYMYRQWMSKSRFEMLGRSLRQNHNKILSVKEYIDRNVHQNFNLDELAEMSGLSRYFFCRTFKKILGESPINYVNRCKVNKAKRLLVETEKSIKEIQYECGFENESHFFKLFKRYVFVSPAVFRQQNTAWKT